MRLIRETIHFGHQLPCIPNLVHLSVSVSVGLVGYNLGNFKLPRTFCLFLLSFEKFFCRRDVVFELCLGENLEKIRVRLLRTSPVALSLSESRGNKRTDHFIVVIVFLGK